MELRAAKQGEAKALFAIIDQARAHLKAQGIDQWQNGYPNFEMIETDIKEGTAYVLEDGDILAGYVFIDLAGDPFYDGSSVAWRQDGPYAAVHRVAINDAYRGKGYAATLFDLVSSFCRERGARSLRIDTHRDNGKMQFVLKRSGFEPCGTVYYPTAGERIAFEKLLG